MWPSLSWQLLLDAGRDAIASGDSKTVAELYKEALTYAHDSLSPSVSVNDIIATL